MSALFAMALLAAGCGGAAEGSEGEAATPPAPPREIVVLLDRSGSVTDTELAEHERVLTGLTEQLGFGDRLVLLVAHAEGVRNGVTPQVAEMPTAKNPRRPLPREETALVVGRQVAQQAVASVFRVEEVPSTDLLASIHTASNQFRSQGEADRAIVLMSDMLQCASGVCFGRPGTVPNGDWISKRKQEGTVPNLAGVCIVAVGPDPSTPHGVAVRDFWEAYFAASGAVFGAERYRHTVPDAGAVGCG